MEFSQSFIDKYSTPDKHAEMQEIINKSYIYCDEIKAKDEDKELIFETLYGFKHIIADKAGIDMEKIYPKVGLISSISEEPYDKDLRAVGLCYWNSTVEGKPIAITYSDKCIDRGEDYKKSVLIHEYCHALSAGYVKDNNEVYITSTGLNGTYIDEAVNDFTARKIGKYLDYESQTRRCDVICQEGDNARGLTETDVSGYVSIAEYTRILQSMCGAEELYKDKFEKTECIEDIIGKQTHEEFEGALRRINNKENALDDHLAIERLALPSVERKWDNIDDYNISDYMKESKFIKYAATRIIIEDGNREMSFDSISANQSAFEIQKIYSQFSNMKDGRELIREMNPATRSQECYDFLIVMEAIKKSNETYTDEQLWNMTYKRVKVDGESVIQLKIGDDKFNISGDIDKNTGLTFCDSMSLSKNKFNLLDKFMSKPIKEDVDISFSNMAEMNKYTGIYDKIMDIAGNHSIPIEATDQLKFIFAGERGTTKEHLSYLMENIDIDTIKDSNNNNLFHILAKNDNFSTNEIIQYMNELNPEATQRLMNMPNKDGLTPLDMAHSYGNLNMIYSAISNEITDKSTKMIEGNSFDAKEGRFISSTETMLNCKNIYFLNKLVNSGMDVSGTDNKGNTLLHYYASGMLDGLEVHQIMNKGADINAKNDEGKTPLSIAVSCFEVPETASLLQFGANPDCIGELLSDPRMRYGFESKDFQYNKGQYILDKLIESGANPNYREDVYGPTPLHIAAGFTDNNKLGVDYETVEKLIRAGADPLQDSRQYPSLRDYAAENGDVKLFSIMIDSGIDRDILDIDNTRLTAADKMMLDKIEITVDIDLTDNILAHQKLLNDSKTADLDMEEQNEKMSSFDLEI